MPVHTQGKRSVLPPAGWVLLLYPDRNPEPQRDVPAGLVVLDQASRPRGLWLQTVQKAEPNCSGHSRWRLVALGVKLPAAQTLGSSCDPQLQRTAEKLKVSTSSDTALKKALGAGTL